MVEPLRALGALHRRIAHQRSDWLHKLTTDLAGRHAVIAIEHLAIKSMTASAKGTLEQPGRNVRAKAGLNRGILDAAWGEFARQLAYKVQWRRGRVDERAISAESLLAPKDRITTP